MHTSIQTHKQGEEADVVVVSMVRSNSKGQIGFVREPERVNVMLSRAHDGLIIFGSSDCLTHASSPAARQYWQTTMSRLRAAGSVHPGLPVACQQHGTPAFPPLASPSAFASQAPDGGCCLPCLTPLPCGHCCQCDSTLLTVATQTCCAKRCD